jgi:hypothetical protein
MRMYKCTPLIVYRLFCLPALVVLKPRPKAKNLRSLLHSPSSSASPPSDDEQQQQEAGGEEECAAPTNITTAATGPGKNETATADLVPFWKPTLALHLVHHFEAWPRAAQLPPFIVEQVGRWGAWTGLICVCGGGVEGGIAW